MGLHSVLVLKTVDIYFSVFIATKKYVVYAIYTELTDTN